jgi:mono/diheme cytochrome c family protein
MFTKTKSRFWFSFITFAAVTATLGLGVSQRASAEEGNRATRVPLLPAYKTECAACHLAYPPAMLPAGAWQHILGNLHNHFGMDASLDPVQTKELSTWLSANAATGRWATGTPPEDRITRSRWFVRQHDEVSAAAWKRPAVKSASNCAACHTTAEKGDFNERNVKIPR